MAPAPPPPISPGMLRRDLYAFPAHHDASPPLVIPVLASLLERAVARNERLQLGGLREQHVGAPAARHPPGVVLSFDGRRVPDMGMRAFLERVYRYTGAAPSVFVVAYVYVDRACRLHPGLRVTQANAHRLLLAAIMVASKFLEDRNYRNSHFAEVGGFPTSEVNRMEVDLLFLMGFKLHVGVRVFDSYCRHLEREVSHGGGYQIERALRSVSGAGGIAIKEKGKTSELDDSASGGASNL